MFAMIGVLVVNVGALDHRVECPSRSTPVATLRDHPGGPATATRFLRPDPRVRRPRACDSGWVSGRHALVLWSYLQAMVFTHIQIARHFTYWPDGPWYSRPIPEAPLWALWTHYTALASYWLGRPPYGTVIVVWTHDLSHGLIYTLIVLVPHVLAALGGGMLGMFVARLGAMHSVTRREPDVPAT